MIILYDIPSRLTDQPSWSANVLKARLSLNYKRIPFVVKYVEYPDIEKCVKSIGGLPTATKADGRPLYTLPAIQDSATGAVVTDSVKIAKYLDATYPNTPSGPLLPSNTHAAIGMFMDTFLDSISPSYIIMIPAVHGILNAASQAYFRATREPLIGSKLEEAAPPHSATREELWKKTEEGFNKLAKWYEKNGQDRLWFLGETFSFADAFAAAYLSWMMIVLGEDSEEWKRVASWNEGRWAKLVDATAGLRTGSGREAVGETYQK